MFFFHLSFFPSSLLRKGEQKKDCFTDPDSRKSVSTNAAYYLKAGAKVELYNIHTKYIRGFFRVSLEHYYKTLIDKCVENMFFKEDGKSGKRDTL